ncbi:MAG: PEP-CTERM sorting domain-containing protein [Microcystis aeruginosa Ma_MB_S_20031200_S102]|uniref:PEP-CTERM sorting domain-containing protein n=1 Tax=Microcystis aeruginosa Ma_MB_S_20031200_S102 TaxID=2486254 RepID=A0A552ETX2_MICAE|nr:MAG: PEP-CTERM sorting domain-containing protein [Microcystis aeruginosa Ma_MB_S_20031200_S102D]TRU37895.1 MAG: PEP-CTERM sorting domain-containing protein [Microcystis aeruginosa Ma_MB_S_20031200_S102]
MITNISRQLTTGVLAIAGSVAAFGFGGIAQAQLTTANATFGGGTGGVTFTGNLSTATSITFNSLTGGVSDVPVNYTPFGGTPAPNVFNSGPAGTTFAPFTSTFNVAIAGGGSSLDFTGAGAGNSTEGITLNFASTTAPTNRYTFTASSGRINSQSDFGLNISFLGSFADSGGSFSTSAATVTIAIASSGVGQGTNTFTFGTPPAFASTSVPEPSAILGILAVAGIGAFARRKS